MPDRAIISAYLTILSDSAGRLLISLVYFIIVANPLTLAEFGLFATASATGMIVPRLVYRRTNMRSPAPPVSLWLRAEHPCRLADRPKEVMTDVIELKHTRGGGCRTGAGAACRSQAEPFHDRGLPTLGV
jgi:hypothetical protein